MTDIVKTEATNDAAPIVLPPVIYEIEILPSSAPAYVALRSILSKSSVQSSCSQPAPNIWDCENCRRSFKTERGLKQHANRCKQKLSTGNEHLIRPVAIQEIRNEPLVWGSYTLLDIDMIINSTYDEIVHWRRNVFMLPSGASGKAFTRATTRLLEL